MAREQRTAERVRFKTVVRSVAIGLAAGLIAIFLAVVSAGAGHGDYGLARALFPYTMALTTLTDQRITNPLLAVAAAQFPLYGLMIGCAATAGKTAFLIAVAVLVVCHGAAAAFCFSGAIPNFS